MPTPSCSINRAAHIRVPGHIWPYIGHVLARYWPYIVYFLNFSHWCERGQGRGGGRVGGRGIAHTNEQKLELSRAPYDIQHVMLYVVRFPHDIQYVMLYVVRLPHSIQHVMLYVVHARHTACHATRLLYLHVNYTTQSTNIVSA